MAPRPEGTPPRPDDSGRRCRPGWRTAPRRAPQAPRAQAPPPAPRARRRTATGPRRRMPRTAAGPLAAQLARPVKASGSSRTVPPARSAFRGGDDPAPTRRPWPGAVVARPARPRSAIGAVPGPAGWARARPRRHRCQPPGRLRRPRPGCTPLSPPRRTGGSDSRPMSNRCATSTDRSSRSCGGRCGPTARPTRSASTSNPKTAGPAPGCPGRWPASRSAGPTGRAPPGSADASTTCYRGGVPLDRR